MNPIQQSQISFDGQSITFVLPGDFRSGGVRVTVIMANHLLSKGLHCRIVCPEPNRSFRGSIKAIRNLLTRKTNKNSGWLHQFKGDIKYYDKLDDLDFVENEIVIAVGSYTVEDVRSMAKKVIKVRFNHGMPTDPKPEHENAWKGSMPTITVSKTLIPLLVEQSGEDVLAVIPNGIDRSQYFERTDESREGIGAVYNPHANKAPQDLIRLLQLAHQRWPHTPQYVFSTEPCPDSLKHTTYTRYPSVKEACKIYNRAKVWLMTSKTEGLPGVALEAMSCGCVMVSSDNDGSLEIINHNENGLIAPQANLETYLAHIETVLSDEELFTRLSSGAIATANSMTWEKAADKMIDFIRDTLPLHTTTPR